MYTFARPNFERSLFLVVQSTQHHHLLVLHKLFISTSSEALPFSLAPLSPYLDTGGIIRVAGCLRHYTTRHNLLLPNACSLSMLLILHYHLPYLNAGPQLASSLLAQRYWIMSAWEATNRINTIKCIYYICQRAITPTHIMTDFPSTTVRLSRPFAHIEVDYAWPFLIKDRWRKSSLRQRRSRIICLHGDHGCAHWGQFWLYHRCFHCSVTSRRVSSRTPVIHIFGLRWFRW